jgi:uncharacterized protein YukE
VKSISKIAGTILSAGLLAGTIWLLFNYQSAVDWYRLRGYEPSPAISALATDTSMSEEGRHIFYVYHPDLLDKSNFQGKCTLTEETIVLGCYLSDEKIYIFDVNDPRLEGVEQVTAAHEMLHAAYDRISSSERESLDIQLVAYYKSINNERLNSTIENYRKRDPSVIPNELHSILGTEYRDLPLELEAHYSKYFTDRTKVVTLSEAYDSEFTKREERIKNYDEQLKNLSESITLQENQLTQLGSALEQEQSQLESLKKDVNAYNAAVPIFNQKVRDYNYQLEQLKKEIARYNELVSARNAIATEEQELIEAIDSRALEL